MIDHAERAGLVAVTLALCAVAGACDSQAAARSGAVAAVATAPAADASESPYPQIRAPYDETSITPMETVGAARSE